MTNPEKFNGFIKLFNIIKVYNNFIILFCSLINTMSLFFTPDEIKSNFISDIVTILSLINANLISSFKSVFVIKFPP